MTHLVEFPLQGGGSIWVEAEDLTPAGPTVRGRTSRLAAVTKAEQSFEEAVGGLAPMLGGLLERLRATAGPAEVEVEFAIKLSADANLIVARTGGEANFRVIARWAAERRASGQP